ncbi:hypothetical protein [Pseudotabrizicola formosa]|uniref:hypothetical protein n=1 Tax=Pseudotabrizicola formosa TaxID=2030009 RepID=UPI000CD0A371|nr:hypothetical protein [Pseudotabrizicola formosa]
MQIAPDLYGWSAVNLWFDADVGRVVNNMTIIEKGHNATFKHPIFSIVLLPPTRALLALGLSLHQALALILAVNAGLFAFLMDRTGHGMGLRPLDRALLLALCLAGAGFVFWLPMPETFPFGATTLMAALYIITRVPAPVGRWAQAMPWAAGVMLAMSMTITNILMVVAGGAVALVLAGSRWRELIPSLLLGGALGLSVLVVVALLQDAFFGDAGLFFNPFSLANEIQFVGQSDASSLIQRLQTLWLQPVVAGSPVMPGQIGLNNMGVANAALLADGRWPMGMVGQSAMVGWLGLIGWAGWALIRNPLVGQEAARRIWLTAVGFLGLNTMLHLIYGKTVFLYLAHFVGPLVLVIVAPVLMQGWIRARLLVAAVVVLAMISNAMSYLVALDMAETLLGLTVGS